MHLFINVILGLLFALAAIVVVVVVRIYTYKPALPVLSPIGQAVSDGDTALVTELLKEGADPDTKLFAAYRINEDGGYSVKMVMPLFGRGSYKDGAAVLPFAAMEGSTGIVCALLEHGADVNRADEYGQTPLILAAWSGDVESVRLLLAKQANVDAHDKDGRTALAWARLMKRHEAVEVLISAGVSE